MTSFADRLIERVRRLDTPLCVGLDPYPDRIPPLFGAGLAALEAFGSEIIALAAPRAAALKPQSALFEAFGWEGMRVLDGLIAHARACGLPVLLDAKRGDIGATAAGYAEAALGPAPGYDADAVTVSPYMGADSLEPFVAVAEARNKGVAVLVRTSNPGARDLQDLAIAGEPLWWATARLIEPISPRLLGDFGWSGLMAVAGATAPKEAAKLRELLPQALFLVPGYGAQGASAAEAVAGFRRGLDGRREGGVVNSSRGVLYPPQASAAATLADWRTAIATALQAAADELRTATYA